MANKLLILTVCINIRLMFAKTKMLLEIIMNVVIMVMMMMMMIVCHHYHYRFVLQMKQQREYLSFFRGQSMFIYSVLLYNKQCF